MNNLIFLRKPLILFFLISFTAVPGYAVFGLFEKEKPQTRTETEKLSEDDKVGFVARDESKLGELQSVSVNVKDSYCDSCVFKIKSVLQENPEIYFVKHSGFNDFKVYFKEGKKQDPVLVQNLIASAGFKADLKK